MLLTEYLRQASAGTAAAVAIGWLGFALPASSSLLDGAARADAGGSETGEAVPLRPGTRHFFARATPAATSGTAHNYEFVQFTVESAGRVIGSHISQPYGTDGMVGSFRGVYAPEEGVVRTRLEYLAEGERYNRSQDYFITATGLDLGPAEARAQPATLPRLTPAAYRGLMADYEQQMLAGSLNTSDRSRLRQVQQLRQVYSEAQLEEIRFLERYVDLDHDPATAEYLLYVVDRMLCGTGGCNLFVIDGDGRTLSDTTVVKLPIYTTRTSIDETRARKGSLRNLYVWSQGMRRLEARDGRYPRNASLEPRVLMDQLTGLPDHYRLLMDHLRD